MSPQQTPIKAVFFDFVGTCLDWHTSVLESLPSSIPKAEASKFALELRRKYFIENDLRFRHNLPPEDIDETLARVLEVVVTQLPGHTSPFDADAKRRVIEAYHSQPPWPEVHAAMCSLRDDLGLELFVHANGTTRLQLDLTRASGLNFDMLFSSTLLGLYKPDPESYKKALQLVKLRPEEVVMVAAHAYDLRGAQKCGMKTVYIHRWTDDVDEDMEKVRIEFDAFLEGMDSLPMVLANMDE